jgi:hypothetical protein
VAAHPAYNVYVGGFFGYSKFKELTFTDCENTGDVNISVNIATNQDIYAGGFVGRNRGAVVVTNGRNTGDISVTSTQSRNAYIGGFAGHTDTTSASFSACVNYGKMENLQGSVATEYVGGIVGYTTGTMTMTGNTNSATGTVSIVAQSSDGYRSAAGGVIGFTDAASHTLTGNINRANVLTDCPNEYTPAGGVVGLVRGNMVSSQNINFGNVAAVSTKTSDVFAGGIVGIFDMKATNKTASLTADKSFGAVSASARSGLLFSAYASDCYGKVTITDCIVGGSRQQGTGAATEITATNFASHLWSWVRSGAVNDTLIQKNTTFGKAADYSTAGLEEGAYNTTKW